MQPESKVDEKLEDMVKSFKVYNRSKNLSKSTLKYYRNHSNKFLEWMKDEKGYSNCGELQQMDIYEYTEYLLDSDIKPVTVNTNLRAVRALVNFGISEKYLDANLKIKLVETEEKVKETYSQAELQKLLKKPSLKNSRFPTYRTWVAINFLLATGVRLRTIVNVKNGDLDFTNRLIELKKLKNKKVQIIPMSRSLAPILREYLSYRKGTDEDYLFCTEDGSKLSTSGFGTALERFHMRRGVNKYSTHLYRHTFAKMAIKSGIDPIRLQKLLGHSTLEMTRRYINLFGTDLQEGFNDYNPLEVMRRE